MALQETGCRRVVPSLTLMCGLAFSGKSTAARRVAGALAADLISLDAINHERGLRGGEGIPVEEWERTSHLALARAAAALATRRSVVVDDTFSHRFLRDRFRAVAARRQARLAILYMDTPLTMIEARRAANERTPTRHRVRDDVFAAHRDTFEHPDDDEQVIRLTGDASLEAWIASQRV